MEVTEMKALLKEIESITFSEHFHGEKVKLRGIAEDEVNSHLASPLKLIDVDDQGGEPKGHKYSFLFSKSGKYDLKVVVSIKDKRLNVITAHIQNIKRRKVYEKWLGRQR
ncbi:MAG: hypothetical protein HYW25_01775 [Candidatus Aenigmarchaeota archaeon]|nr:hypothetical protein [Candidatus Aenigmarchaeota archaeon]